MTYDPYKNARREVERRRGEFSIGIGEVVAVPENRSHRVVVKPLTNTGEGEPSPFHADVSADRVGDVSVPTQGELVVYGKLNSGRRIVLGSVYSDQDTVPEYVDGVRRIGHDETGANITIDESGNISLEAAEGGTVTIGDTGQEVGSGLDNPLSFPHTQWSESMSQTEIWRVTLESDEKLNVYRVNIALKDGLSNSDLTLDIYDVDNDEVLVSTDGVTRGTPAGESGYGSTVLARLTNAADHQHVAALSSRMTITTN